MLIHKKKKKKKIYIYCTIKMSISDYVKFLTDFKTNKKIPDLSKKEHLYSVPY